MRTSSASDGANVQHFTGKPWAATAQIGLRQGDQRILLEPRGSRRLSSQTLLDLRVSRPFSIGGAKRVELLVDVLNLLNEQTVIYMTKESRIALLPTSLPIGAGGERCPARAPAIRIETAACPVASSFTRPASSPRRSYLPSSSGRPPSRRRRAPI